MIMMIIIIVSTECASSVVVVLSLVNVWYVWCRVVRCRAIIIGMVPVALCFPMAGLQPAATFVVKRHSWVLWHGPVLQM